jgi:tetratricopeptide (TPR) repeat protein
MILMNDESEITAGKSLTRFFFPLLFTAACLLSLPAPSVVCAEQEKGDPRVAEAAGLFEEGQIDKAIEAALNMEPGMSSSKTGLGLALLKKGDFKGAEGILTEALALNPYPSTTHYALGLVYEKMNDYEKAVRHFKEGMKTFKSGKK